MSTPEEIAKQKIERERAEEEELAKKKQQTLEEEAAKGKKPPVDEGPKKPAEESTFKADKGSDWEKIVAAYQEKHKREPEGAEKNILRFASETEAMAFFKSQAEAKPPREFFMQKLEGGKPVDNYAFSCGSGQLFNGKLSDIQTQLKEALIKDPDNKKLQEGQALVDKRIAAMKSTDMRANLGSMKEKAKTEQTPPEPTKTEEHGHKGPS